MKKKLNIFRNSHSKGFSCLFEYKGQGYYADLTYCRDNQKNELMIFKADLEKKEVTNRDELYCAYFDEVSPKNVKLGILDFMAQIDEKDNDMTNENAIQQ